MYSQAGIQKGDGSPEVAVLDTIHGAFAIAKALRERGIQAQPLEVYHASPAIDRYDLIVAPVHLSLENPALIGARKLAKRIISHHKAVGAMLKGDRGFWVFEITGTRGKTTTALMLSRILSRRMRTISHTTSGIELWSHDRCIKLRQGLSIAPANVLAAHDEAKRSGAEALVCEVSLGGTGIADFGILTSLAGDYPIAGSSMWASTAKLQMISLSEEHCRIVASTQTGISADMSFGPGGAVRINEGFIETPEGKIVIPKNCAFDLDTYLPAIAGATSAAIEAGVDLQAVSESLEGFCGFSGRMYRSFINGIPLYDNSNSGLQVSGVAAAMNWALGRRYALVVGEEAQTVCEGMDILRLVELLFSRRDSIDLLVLVGKRLEPYASALDAKIAQDLKTGLDIASDVQGIELILSCVKCFR